MKKNANTEVFDDEADGAGRQLDPQSLLLRHPSPDDEGHTRKDTDNAPVFPEVWRQIEALIEGLPLVAHNRPFDEGCLKSVFRVYQMDYPGYEFYDTLSASRRALPDLPNHQLHTVAEACGYQLKNHHHALADAEACAWIARKIL